MVDKSILIAGSGLAGLSLATELDYSHLELIDKDRKDKNDRTWCFWTTKPEEYELHDEELLTHTWKKFRTYRQDNTMRETELTPYTYCMIRSKDWYSSQYLKLYDNKHADSWGDIIQSIQTHPPSIQTNRGTYHADLIFDSLPPDLKTISTKKYTVLLQHFTGWWIETAHPVFDPETATFMDFRTPQNGDTRFFYVLPLTPTKALVEFTVISSQVLQTYEYQINLKMYLKTVLKIQDYVITETEYGVIPMTDYPFYSESEAVLQIGTKGGWVKPSSGFAFTRTEKRARIIAGLIEKNQPLKPKLWRSKFRFRLYDSIILSALTTHKISGESFFTRLFERVSLPLILKFLDEETGFFEELRILILFPQFLPIFIRKIFHFLVI